MWPMQSQGRRGCLTKQSAGASPVADDCSIAAGRFEPFIGVPTKFGEGPHWVSLRKARGEHMFSGMHRIAARSEPCRHLRSAP